MRNIVILFFLFFLAGCNIRAEEDVKKSVINYAVSLHPETQLLEYQDMDIHSCGSIDANPGFIATDLNNDGLQGYALLLKGKVEDYIYEGKKYDSLPLWLVIMFGDEKGKFKTVFDESVLTGVPSGVGIEKAVLSDYMKLGDKLTTGTSGVMLYFCERSSTLLYWDGKNIAEYSITD